MDKFEVTESPSDKTRRAVHFYSFMFTVFLISRYLSNHSILLAFFLSLVFAIVVSLINLTVLVLVETYLIGGKNNG